MSLTREIYIVDDSADQRFIIQTVFDEHLPQYQIRLFESGHALYEHLIMLAASDYNGRQPGLIILDLKMPHINGFELLRLLRRSPQNEKINWKMIPIVIMSSYDLETEIVACQKAGANSFYKRPISLAEMRLFFQTICQYWLRFHQVPKVMDREA